MQHAHTFRCQISNKAKNHADLQPRLIVASAMIYAAPVSTVPTARAVAASGTCEGIWYMRGPELRAAEQFRTVPGMREALLRVRRSPFYTYSMRDGMIYHVRTLFTSTAGQLSDRVAHRP